MRRVDRRRAGGSGGGSGAGMVAIVGDPEGGSSVTFRHTYTKFGLKQVTGGRSAYEKASK